MKEKLKPKIKKHELILIIINTLVYVVWLFFNNDLHSVISWASYMFYMLALFFASVGKWKSHAFNIISYLIYLYICIQLFYVGEIISTLLSVSLSVVFIFSWKKKEQENKYGERVLDVSKIKAKEFVIINIIGVIVFVVSFLIFNFIESNEVLLNSLIMAFAIISYYFTFRVSKLSFFYGFVSTLLYMLLWLKTFTSGSDFASIYIIGSAFSLVWSFVSIINWKKMEQDEYRSAFVSLFDGSWVENYSIVF